MKKILYAIAALAVCFTLSQCKPNEYLSVPQPDKMDNEFVTSSVSETFKTLSYCYRTYLSVAGGGNYNWNDSASDAEYYPEYNSGNGRIGYLDMALTGVNSKSGQFTNLFTILARCSRIAGIIEQKDEFKNATGVNDWTQLWGEAWTMWAYCYTELIRHFGDVPFGLENQAVDEGFPLTSRFTILDNVIAKLKEVESSMYYLGQGGIQAERMSRTFANMLIAEANLMAGGYQTLRTDVDGLYEGISFETMYTNSSDKVNADLRPPQRLADLLQGGPDLLPQGHLRRCQGYPHPRHHRRPRPGQPLPAQPPVHHGHAGLPGIHLGSRQPGPVAVRASLLPGPPVRRRHQERRPARSSPASA